MVSAGGSVCGRKSRAAGSQGWGRAPQGRVLRVQVPWPHCGPDEGLSPSLHVICRPHPHPQECVPACREWGDRHEEGPSFSLLVGVSPFGGARAHTWSFFLYSSQRQGRSHIHSLLLSP